MPKYLLMTAVATFPFAAFAESDPDRLSPARLATIQASFDAVLAPSVALAAGPEVDRLNAKRWSAMQAAYVPQGSEPLRLAMK